MLKIVFIITLILYGINDITAQYKIGAVNTTVVFNKLVEVENTNTILKRYQDSLAAIAAQKEKDLNEQIIARSCDDCPPLPDSTKKTKRQQLIEQVNALQNFYELIETLCIKKSKELMQSLRQRLKDAVQQVATENNYHYILDMSDEHLNFLPLPPYDDITSLVVTKLGL